MACTGLLEVAQACVQVDLRSIKNTNGVITDYESPEDELIVWFGVGEGVLYTWKNTMMENQERAFPKGVISLPCFYDEVFYIEVTEDDAFVSDKSQINLACKNFQLGQNEIVIEVKEDNSGINSAADVFNNLLGTSFRFGDKNVNDGKQAQYTFIFEVEQNCNLRPDVKSFVKKQSDLGVMNYYSVSIPDVL